jgi:alginate O-acetyltransferase complex protein AlgI
MVFSSPIFLFVFLPLAVGAGALLPARARNPALLALSIVFYAFGAGSFVLAMLVTTAADYLLGRAIARQHLVDRTGRAQALLAVSIVQNLLLLAYFKYAGFLVEQVDRALGHAGLGHLGPLAIALPIGISFFTFERISYVVDVYRGDIEPCTRLTDLLLFAALFPRSIAGPIVRYREIGDQIRSRTVGVDDVVEGLQRFALGLVKKVVVADTVSPIADAAFAQPHPSTATAWAGAIAYTIQIYFDFSGYSDMAIGIARALGFVLPENFNRPYSAVSITDFWRRWHMTLSRWFRDYLYVPLGGSRGRRSATYRNLVVTFLLTGAWHGASWTFVVWGAYHGGWLLLERATGLRGLGDGTRLVPLRRCGTLVAVVVGWVIFRAPDLHDAASVLVAMVVPTGAGVADAVRLAATPAALVVGAAASVVFFLPRSYSTVRLALHPTGTAGRLARLALIGVGYPWALVVALGGSFSPFLYFRF